MAVLFTFIFFIITITDFSILSFSVFLSSRQKDSIWKKLPVLYFFITAMSLLQLIQVYLNSSLPFESISQLSWFVIHSDISSLLCLSLPAVFHTVLNVPYRETGNPAVFIVLFFVFAMKVNPYLVLLLYGHLSYFISIPYMDAILMILTGLYDLVVTLIFFRKLKPGGERQTAVSLVFLTIFLYLDNIFIIWRLFFIPLDRILNIINLLFYLVWNLFFILFFIWNFKKIPDYLLNIDLSGEFSLKYGLTERETEIVKLLLEGKNKNSIGEKFFLSPKTINNHVYNIYRKTGVKSRMELAFLVNKSVINKKG